MINPNLARSAEEQMNGCCFYEKEKEKKKEERKQSEKIYVYSHKNEIKDKKR